ncbi:hypothetical protein [Stackebrandtia nassauensis]|uniref:hypothetical protein n=1 Tax=Stackebrandtia nassauensis TaxID=283811 RepID=UPI0002D29848|nr:hypothetical protein [Stackebrandtia nassauensis]
MVSAKLTAPTASAAKAVPAISGSTLRRVIRGDFINAEVTALVGGSVDSEQS